jgi:hypothetical protein
MNLTNFRLSYAQLSLNNTPQSKLSKVVYRVIYIMGKIPIYEQIVRTIARFIVPIAPPKYYSSINEEIRDTWSSVGNGLRKSINQFKKDIKINK